MKKGEIEMDIWSLIIIAILLIVIGYQDSVIRKQEILVFISEAILNALDVQIEEIEEEDKND